MSSSELFNELDSYNWDADQEFQLGLKGILDSTNAQTVEQREDLVLRARCFYFARKFGKQIDFEAYKAAHVAKSTISTSTSNAHVEESSDDDPPSIPYAELVEMIQTGKPVPGIKDIPDTVLSGQGTQSVVTKRRKPWEKDSQDSNDASAPQTAVTAPIEQTHVS